MVPLQGVEVVPTPICANKLRNDPVSSNQGHSTASQLNYHVIQQLRGWVQELWSSVSELVLMKPITVNLSSLCLYKFQHGAQMAAALDGL